MKEYSADKSGAQQKDALTSDSPKRRTDGNVPGELNPAGGRGQLAGAAWQFGRQSEPSKAEDREESAPAPRSSAQEAAQRHLNAKLVAQLLRTTGLDLSGVLLTVDPSLEEQGKAGAAVDGKEIKVAPSSAENDAVLAHEAGHIIQQMPVGARAAGEPGPKEGAGGVEGQKVAPEVEETGGSEPGAETKGPEPKVDLEAEANDVAAAVLSGGTMEVRGVGTGVLYEEGTKGSPGAQPEGGEADSAKALEEKRQEELERAKQQAFAYETEYKHLIDLRAQEIVERRDAAIQQLDEAIEDAGVFEFSRKEKLEEAIEKVRVQAEDLHQALIELGSQQRHALDGKREALERSKTIVAQSPSEEMFQLQQQWEEYLLGFDAEVEGTYSHWNEAELQNDEKTTSAERDEALQAQAAPAVEEETAEAPPAQLTPEEEAAANNKKAFTKEMDQSIETKAKAGVYDEPEEVKGAMARWTQALSHAWTLDKEKIIDWVVGNQAPDAAKVLRGNYFPDQHDKDFSNEEHAASAEEVEPAQKNGVPMENRAAALDEKLLKDNPLDVNRLLIRGALEAKSHFELMRAAMEAAKKGTINIAGPRSAFRPASQQNADWTGKYGDTTAPELARGPNYEPSPAGQKKQEHIIADVGKAGPYSSRHGQGTDFDLGSTNNFDFDLDDLAREKKKLSERKQAGESLTAVEQKTLNRTTPKYAKQFGWLNENAWKYGFFRPYHGDKFGDEANYPKENWHWSYYPVAQAFEQLIKNHMKDFNDHLAVLFMAYEKKHEKNGRIPDMTSFVALKWVELHQNINKKLVDE